MTGMFGATGLKRVYEIAALLALLNMLVLGGVVTAAALSGSITGEKLRSMVAIMQGQGVTSPEVQEEDEVAPEDQESAKGDVSMQSQVDEEIVRRELARSKEELAQRLAQVNQALLRHKIKAEEFEKRRLAVAVREEAVATVRDQAGFKKRVELFDGLKAAVAVEFLLMEEPDEAARILLEMDVRKAKKVVEEAKKLNQMQRMQDILQRIGEVAPLRSEELETE